MSIAENIQEIQLRIKQAALSVGRDPQDIKIVAVTKTMPIGFVEQVIQAGVTDIGENRVQEAIPKIEALKVKYPEVTWHMIGHLQRNKVRQALDLFAIIQSLDSERLALEIQAKAKCRVPVLIEVNTSREVTKFGVPVSETIALVKKVSTLSNLKIEGLMTIGPLAADSEKARPSFKSLRQLSEQIKKLNLPNVNMKYLSMGMTDDFNVAIEEGSNLVRIGRALFGARR